MTPDQRFDDKVVPVPESGCWLWTASTSRNSYGKFWTGEKLMAAHRFAYERAHGAIPDGMYVCHKCDTPRCVNPDHLFLGTPQSNMDDMYRKGRNVHMQGESVNTAKLTESQVVALRERYRKGGVTQRQLAREVGVAPSVMNGLLNGKYWAHVEHPERAARAA